jgi:hypothetical protein
MDDGLLVVTWFGKKCRKRRLGRFPISDTHGTSLRLSLDREKPEVLKSEVRLGSPDLLRLDDFL